MEDTGRAITELHNLEIGALKADIEAKPRLCGYYILGLVSIRHPRAAGTSQEMILDQLIEHFDDDPSEPDPDFVPDHEWTDYEVDHERARTHTMVSLVGGGHIGHLHETMSEATAGRFFDRWVTLCGRNPRFYIGLGLGDSKYVFQHGVLAVATDLAGILWIVEND